MNDVLALILAGGKGSRLEPLTRDRAKPAVPFAGVYRIIDFALSNCLNSGLRKVHVMTQYKAASLDRHIRQAWGFLCRELDEYVDVYPPQQRIDEHWYQGTADAVYQNIYSIEQARPKHIVILSGDHVYKMDYRLMIDRHIKSDADLTIGCLPVDIEAGKGFGVMGVDDRMRVIRFDEKPAEPTPIPGDTDRCLASMGIYVFKADFLFEQLCRDATVPNSKHDFGHNIIPTVIHEAEVYAFPFEDRNTGSDAYWRDVGTIESYYAANMDLVSASPEFDLYDSSWPIRSYQPILPPPKFVRSEESSDRDRVVGQAINSMVCSGTVVSSGTVEGSILSPNVRIGANASVKDSILFEGVSIGRHCQVHRAIIDKNVVIAEGVDVGIDHDADRERGFTVTDSGITVIGKSDALAWRP